MLARLPAVRQDRGVGAAAVFGGYVSAPLDPRPGPTGAEARRPRGRTMLPPFHGAASSGLHRRGHTGWPFLYPVYFSLGHSLTMIVRSIGPLPSHAGLPPEAVRGAPQKGVAMSAPLTSVQFLELLDKSGLIDSQRLRAYLSQPRADDGAAPS